jgi:hypothetical protein
MTQKKPLTISSKSVAFCADFSLTIKEQGEINER